MPIFLITKEPSNSVVSICKEVLVQELLFYLFEKFYIELQDIQIDACVPLS